MGWKRAISDSDDTDSLVASSVDVSYSNRRAMRLHIDYSNRRVTRQQARAAIATASPPVTVNESWQEVILAPASSSAAASKRSVALSSRKRLRDREQMDDTQLEDLLGESAEMNGREKGPDTNNVLSSSGGSLQRCHAVIDKIISSVGLTIHHLFTKVVSPVVTETAATSLERTTPYKLVGHQGQECHQSCKVEASAKNGITDKSPDGSSPQFRAVVQNIIPSDHENNECQQNCRVEASAYYKNPEKTCSFGLTEMVNMLTDDVSGEEEVESHVPDSITVQGYTVKKESAPIVSAILLKYGDIAANCFLETMKNRSRFLEDICVIIKEMEGKKFVEIKESEVSKLLADVDDLYKVNVEIEWLRSRLEDIREVKRCLSMKHEKDENKRIIEDGKQTFSVMEREVGQIQQRMEQIKESIKAAEDGNRVISERAKKSKANLMLFMKESLIHGLL